ncbi:hypothetical protein FUA23_18045 [Neolewinella aurantiaca]|uniref:Methylmalonyl-CoA mutase alpha/beta chain catalytic domain-containing protein n=1 Tax=Neolewinella aurantiaca TaxID=2602767 RepID=A0A5C7FAE4_9BACT|nr:methylmalonyl-CoA mutase family protein [Neolewinella aurantiaca]TXF87602.1 hypothetical protein FUA23_18045 [Neolewinella aurantiaca]
MQTNFPEVSKAEWLAKVEKDLKGKSLDSLDFEVSGETFSPVHHRDDLATLPRPVRTTSGCRLGVFIEVQDAVSANKLALEALNGGADYLYLYDPLYTTGKEGYQEKLYAGILTDIVEVVWHNHPTSIVISGIDTIAQELYNFSGSRGESTLWLSPGTEYLTNIAFFRATRLCASLIMEHSSEITGFRTGVVVEGDEKDPNTAKIRTTAQAMAAINGGADILMIKPSDGKGDTAFERRIARNVHHLLTEESHLTRVADPATGSYYIESLTDHLARKIWAKFQLAFSA